MNPICSLSGPWILSRPATGDSYSAVVPGDVYSDLLTAGVIDKPFYRDNETRYRWVAEENWAYQKEFDVPQDILEKAVQKLIFEGIDTIASITLNGVHLADVDNMFRRYELNVTGLLRPTGNLLRVDLRAPLLFARSVADRLPFKIPYTGEAEWVITHTHRNLLRKCQCQAGWDWGPAFLTSGIWKDVSLIGYDTARIRQIKTVQCHGEENVILKVHFQLDVHYEGEYTVDASVAGQTISQTFSLSPGDREIMVELTLDRPLLWWPQGYGPQHLHTLKTALVHRETILEERNLRVGFRRVELIREKDVYGESFYFKINGVPIFLKGYNWIPASIFPSRLTLADYAPLIEDTAAAHCNLLRVWGGGIYEHDSFYDLCDELGVLVWQDFMFACAMYPWDETFLANVSEEATEQIWRLSPHPSLLMFCGNNECEQALDWYPESRSHREAFLHGYHKLFVETLGSITEREAPDRPYWPSSPTNGAGVYGDPNDPSRGDVHYWEVWHGGKRFSSYLSVLPRMSTEYGFQSVPSLETLKTALEPSDLNISSPMMDYHQRSAIGNRAMVEHMMFEYRLPSDFRHFIYLSQVQQAMAMKIATEHWRRIKPRNMGTIIWQLNDIWPGNSWSAVEYGGKWKVLHSFARRFFAPVLFSLEKLEDSVDVWATNDQPLPVDGRFTLEARTFDGTVLHTWNDSFTLGAHESLRLMKLELSALKAMRSINEIFLVLYGSDGFKSYMNWEFLAPAKHCPLPKAQVQIDLHAEGKATMITLKADQPVFHGWLEMEGHQGVFDDNAFLLLPGIAKVVCFAPRKGSPTIHKEDIRFTHLAITQS